MWQSMVPLTLASEAKLLLSPWHSSVTSWNVPCEAEWVDTRLALSLEIHESERFSDPQEHQAD